MDEDFIIVGLLSTIGIGGVAVVAGAWMPKQKRLPDWFMAAGGTLALTAFLLLVMIIMGGMGSRWQGIALIGPTLSAVALGILLFAMGYVMDRWKIRQVRTHDTEFG